MAFIFSKDTSLLLRAYSTTALPLANGHPRGGLRPYRGPTAALPLYPLQTATPGADCGTTALPPANGQLRGGLQHTYYPYGYPMPYASIDYHNDENRKNEKNNTGMGCPRG
jgi:hypothetical protein